MKPVSIQTIDARIDRLEHIQTVCGLSLNEEFELQCLRKLFDNTIELDTAKARIAELEAREVQLPKPELVGMGEWPMFNQVDVINALASVGISVKGE